MASVVPAAPAPPPLTGDLEDTGGSRRESVRARRYRARGAVKVVGDLGAVEFALKGFGTIGGRLTVEKLLADGTLDVGKDVVVKTDGTFRGTATLLAGLLVGDLTVHGHLKVAANATVDGDGRIRGRLEVGGNLSARSLQFDGGLEVPGVLDCPVVEGRLRHASRIGSLHSQHVRIVRASLPSTRGSLLVIDRIEASEVEIEGVDCEYLRADRVRLGAEAHVTRLEGQVVRRHRSAYVGARAWEPLPPGLSR